MEIIMNSNSNKMTSSGNYPRVKKNKTKTLLSVVIIILALAVVALGMFLVTNRGFKWSVKDDTLVINGKGEVPSYTDNSETDADGNVKVDVDTPWNESLSDIKNVTVNDGIVKIGDFAFSYLTKVEEVKLPDGVTSLGNGIFRGCSSLKTVTIPASVEYIGEYAFSGCDNLTDIYFGGTTSEWYALYYKLYINDGAAIHCSDGTI